MKNLRRTIQLGVLTFLLGMSAASQAAVLTTTFSGSDGSGGISSGNWTNMFDLTVVAPEGIRITGFTVHVAQTSPPHNLQVYTKPTTYVGSETTLANWTLVSNVGGNDPVATGPSFVDVTDFVLTPGTYGIALLNTNYQVFLTFASNNYSNSDLSIQTGATVQGPFTGGTLNNQTWNGSITYQVVPEPSAGLLLFASGLLLLVRRKRV